MYLQQSYHHYLLTHIISYQHLDIAEFENQQNIIGCIHV